MNPELWQAVGDVFERARDLTPGERTALVERECGNNADLRREVASLLESHRAVAGGFVQDRIKSALASFIEADAAGSTPVRVGPYRLIRELGRGGMGTVFLAERDDDEYHARVAVKLVRPGMDTAFILERFRRERQTLARLQHPNISRLLDGGTTEAGLPYIVMEFIDGPRLTEFAAVRRLGLDDRLRLFTDVCSAVDYAHRNFIVHRDLKPGNILVGPDRVPKLVDFGICKLLHSEPMASETVAAPLTPNYASPEQVLGDPVTPLTDIYSLGAVLYELLTGTCPRRFDALTPRAIEKAITAPILLPSVAVADRTIARHLEGDLDNIVMRALEDEPSRRYESAAQLADDLRRYAADEPVRARPQTVRYRASKFVRRNRVAVAAAAAVFAALTAGLFVSAREARVAAARLDQIRSLSNRLVFDVHDAVRDLPGATRARRVIVQTGLEYLDSAFNSVKGDRRAEIELAKAYRRLGEVQGDPGTQNLGDSAGALDSYHRALALVDAATKNAPLDADAETERTILSNRIAAVQSATGNLRAALDTLQGAIRQGGPMVAKGSVEMKASMADLFTASSELRRNLGDDRGSLLDAQEGVRLSSEASAARSSDRNLRHELATAYAAVGMSETRLGNLQQGLAHFRQGTAEMENLVAAERQNVAWNRDLMLAYGHIGDVLGYPDLQNLGDRAGALQAYRRAADIGRRLHEIDRADLRAASDYGIVLSRLETVMENHDLPAKLAVQQESLRVLDEGARISPDNQALRLYQALVNQHLGDSFTAADDTGSARDAYVKSATLAESGVKSGHTAFLTIFIQTNGRLALNALTRGRRGETIEFAERAWEAVQRLPPGTPASRAVPRGLSVMGLTYAALLRSPLRQTGDLELTRSWLTRSLDAWRASRSEPGWGAPHQREMREVEEALGKLPARER